MVDETARQRGLTVLQQKLIDVSDRLDREIGSLRRMQSFYTDALGVESDATFAEAAAEAIVDVFELEFGVCWLLDGAGQPRGPIGVLGLDAGIEDLRALGAALHALPVTRGTAEPVDWQAVTARLPGVELGGALRGDCVGAGGQTLAIVLGGNTAFGDGIFTGVTPELAGMFGLFTQQLAALIDNRVGRRIIERQLHELGHAQHRLRDSEARYRLVTENNSDLIWSVDLPSRHISYISSAVTPMLGYGPDDVAGQGISVVLPPASMQLLEVQIRLLLQEGSTGSRINPTGRIELDMKHRDGHPVPTEVSTTLVFDDAGQPLSLVGIARDISERRKIQAEMQIAVTAFESSQEGMMVTDANNRIVRVNQAFCEITGYSADEALGRNPNFLSSGKQSPEFYRSLWASLQENGQWEGELWNRRKTGEVFPEFLSITALRDENGRIVNYVASIADITQRKKFEEKIQRLAFYDPLTGLPNRSLLMDRLQQSLASVSRRRRRGGVLFIDLDNFKTLNDTLGHAFGDMLLQQVADRLLQCVREGDTVARLGGDEFVIMLEDLSLNAFEASEQARMISEKIRHSLGEVYHLGRHTHECTPSIGVTIFYSHHQRIDDVVKQADIAMYQAKNGGKNAVCFFDSVMQEAINDRARLESELRTAIENGQLRLFYQVQRNEQGEVLGAEALVRWMHPARGLVSPAQFIPVAEETGLILPMGLWVIETACRQLREWKDAGIANDVVLSVNVSAKQFHLADFVQQIKSAVLRHGIDPHLLKLELTESTLLGDVDDVIRCMGELTAFGIPISLDDFGTGYSSLQYLKRLPISQLKIDRSFVRDIADDTSDLAIVRTIILMAHSLGLDVIAEGVETEEQRRLLQECGCNHYQGYLFGAPVPVEQLALKKGE